MRKLPKAESTPTCWETQILGVVLPHLPIGKKFMRFGRL